LSTSKVIKKPNISILNKPIQNPKKNNKITETKTTSKVIAPNQDSSSSKQSLVQVSNQSYAFSSVQQSRASSNKLLTLSANNTIEPIQPIAPPAKVIKRTLPLKFKHEDPLQCLYIIDDMYEVYYQLQVNLNFLHFLFYYNICFRINMQQHLTCMTKKILVPK
jgi:hypothetical protein